MLSSMPFSADCYVALKLHFRHLMSRDGANVFNKYINVLD